MVIHAFLSGCANSVEHWQYDVANERWVKEPVGWSSGDGHGENSSSQAVPQTYLQAKGGSLQTQSKSLNGKNMQWANRSRRAPAAKLPAHEPNLIAQIPPSSLLPVWFDVVIAGIYSGTPVH
jgi:hypothetical protein